GNTAAAGCAARLPALAGRHCPLLRLARPAYPPAAQPRRLARAPACNPTRCLCRLEPEMSETLETALLDVRKAYRLLADYQQRLFELLGHIRERVGASAYYHQYAYPLPQGLDGLEKRNNSGLRYLPFNDLSAIWLKNE